MSIDLNQSDARVRLMLARAKSWLVLVALGAACSVSAAEIPEGTVISAANFEALKNDTFEGEKLADLVTDSMVTWMNEGGFTMRLARAQPLTLPPKYVEATEKYASKATFNPETRLVEGYVAGLPFPSVDSSDPHAGYKLVWNFVLAGWQYGDTYEVITDTKIFSLDGGLERYSVIDSVSIQMQGRTSVPPTTIDSNEIKRQLFAFREPFDVAGLGTYSIRYADGRLDSSWAYIRTIRRTRRVTGGTWMDPIPGLSQLYEDSYGLDALPTWYQDIKLLGKRKILAVVNGTDPNEPHRPEERVNLAEAPYGAPINQPWEIREVYVIELTPPRHHPYSRKVVYMDTQGPAIFFADTYNQAGDFWKLIGSLFHHGEWADGQPGLTGIAALAIDFRERRGNYVDNQFVRNNNARLDVRDLNVQVLREAASGFSMIQK